jgi:hypothetical protein
MAKVDFSCNMRARSGMAIGRRTGPPKIDIRIAPALGGENAGQWEWAVVEEDHDAGNRVALTSGVCANPVEAAILAAQAMERVLRARLGA